MHLFYEPDILTNGGYLSPEESKHCTKVLRHKAGDTIQIMDGKGNMITGILTDVSKLCKIEISEIISTAPPSTLIHIAVAPTKNIDRFEWFLEKSTEIGIDKITPIVCQNSERKIIKPERLEKIITSAMKQSLSTWRPQLLPITTLSDFIVQQNKGDRFIAHCRNENETHLLNACKGINDTTVLIGPEGDFTMEEISAALQKGFSPISLGEKRLRTETAAMAAVHIISLKKLL